MRWILALFLLLALPVSAQTFPDYERTTITDLADLLNDTQESALDAQLAALRRETGIEFAVLTLPSQAPYAPDLTLEQFATGLFNFWGIGDANRNDGILVLVMPDDRAMRIELGAGYGRDWDRVAANVIDRSFLPAFGNGDYPRGIRTGVDDVIASIARPFSAGTEAPATGSDPFAETFLVPLLVVASFILLAWRNIIDRIITSLRRCPQCGNRTLKRVREVLRRATRATTGTGRVTTHCTSCDYHDERTYTISKVRTSSGGSFGGGRSGGGGASGRW